MSNSLHVVCSLTGETSMDTRAEADSNDVAECSHDDKPSTGLLGLTTSDK